MKIFNKTLLILSLSVGIAHADGDKGGNGGDVLKCTENGKEVYRVLDSVVMKNDSVFDIHSPSTSKESMDKIIQKMKETVPVFAKRLENFVNSFEKKSNLAENGILWIQGKLKQISDENLFVLIPSYCDQDPLQTVTLVKETEAIINGKVTKVGSIPRYYYDSKLINLIRNVDDELTWIIIHEWLRLDYFEDADLIRIVNGYLHSEEFFKGSENDIILSLAKLGMRYVYYTGSQLEDGYKRYDEFQIKKLEIGKYIDSIKPERITSIEERVAALRKLSAYTPELYNFNEAFNLFDGLESKFNEATEETLTLLAKINQKIIELKH